jgi:parallel beta-helix repeat protein
MPKKMLVLMALLFVVHTTAAFAQAGRMPVWMPGTVIAANGSYVVTRNITAIGAAPVIFITAPNVDLDLNGFTLTGFVPGQVISIPGPFSEIRIHNGRLSGGSMSIDAAGTGRKLIIEKVHSQDAFGPGAAALHAFDIENLVIRESSVVGASTLYSIAIDGPTPGKTGVIERNVIESTGGGGIQILFGQAFAVLHNRIDVGGIPAVGSGIELDCNGCLVSENTVRSASADGIVVRQGWGNKFFDNVVEGSAGSGIILGPGAGDSLVLNNVLTMNGGQGLWVQGIRNHVERNTLNGNTGYGLCFTGPANTYGRNMARGNAGAGCGPCFLLFPPESCDVAPGNSSFGDNLIPGPPVF